jgi:hypothetical protein
MKSAGTVSERDFVELRRTFHELSKNQEEHDDLAIHRSIFSKKHLTWAELAEEFRVVVLSEAGTGKTEEIRHFSEVLRSENKAAFFLRLEHIPDDFEYAFEVGTFAEFELWLNSGCEAWLLLDSVDESRLRHPSDFERAVRKIGASVSAALDRLHVIITGRTTAWRPNTDLNICEKHLPFHPVVDLASADGNQCEVEDDDDPRVIEIQRQPNRAEKSIYTIVALDDLDTRQIEIFAAAKGVTDTPAFLRDVERADAIAFTARPQDLAELLEFWNDTGRIGSRLEIMQKSTERRLLERDQSRADARPLSPARAREGARLVAAAATMVQESTIRIPDGADNSTGIPIEDILPDWDDADRAALLSRPIFDEAIYGAVRFHHRFVREFLTAEWLGELIGRETSRRNIEALLFRNQYGLDVVVPSMRPVLPWLAILDERVRERTRQIAPSVLLEGGDPSKLPLETRQQILRQVCEQIVRDPSSRAQGDYAAVQRFASSDLVNDVKDLMQEYAENDDLVFFLLRMVWLGELKDALPEAKSIAMSSAPTKYTRIAAFRALSAIGSPEDNEEVRIAFLGESGELKRDWLAELLDSLEPTEQTVSWLCDCLVKTEAKEPHSFDKLTDAVAEFVKCASIGMLSQIATRLNGLLEAPPFVERRYCEVSHKYSWLMIAAAHVTEKLIEARHATSLENDTLALLYKCAIWDRTDIDERSNSKSQLSTLVPGWPKLNRTFFWFCAHKAQNQLGKNENGEHRLMESFQVYQGGSFCRFESNDFEYVLRQITERSSPVERRVALSLAFQLYVDGGRERKHRNQLHKAVANQPVLIECLARYMKPPAQGRKSWKQADVRRKRRLEAMERKKAKNREEWKEFLQANSDKLVNSGLKPGQLSGSQWYLYKCASEQNGQFDRWTSGNWKRLIEGFGEEVARAYRDGAVGFWRRNAPQLRSEGAPANTVPHTAIFGLTGLQIEANETRDWPNGLSPGEIEVACRYASYELNGFPSWFPALFAADPSLVSRFLLKEIRYELSTERLNAENHYILGAVSWSGQWAWDRLAPDVYQVIKNKEPANISNLDRLLSIVQGSSATDEDVARLASWKGKRLKRLDHVARWFAVWVGVDPGGAIPVLTNRLKNLATPEDRQLLAMQFVIYLVAGHRGEPSNVRTAYRTPEYLQQIYLLMHQHIRAVDDIDRSGKGTYSPGLRDEAQRARNGLAEILRNISGKPSFLTLTEIANSHPDESYRSWFAQLANSRAEMDADFDAWSPRQVRDFHETLERTPKNHRELAELGYLRLLDLKDNLENGDSSIASILQGVQLERDVRKFIGHELREKAFGRYAIPQEEELADAKKPDLRFHGAGFDGPIPIELKLAQNWTGSQLFERLENQLLGAYLRDNSSSRGFFVLVHQGRKSTWKIPNPSMSVDFEGLVNALNDHWKRIAVNYPGVEHIEVIGIDLTRR